MKTIPLGGGTAIFAAQDLVCVNEYAGGAPRYPHQSGVACSSNAQPYRGIGLWLTRTRLTVVRESTGQVVATFHR
ncbi:MAG: hypothetical protein ACRDLK_05505 [Gaiellaceae bacterium]